MTIPNFFAAIPEVLDEERFDELIGRHNLRVERIVSQGHTSPPSGWYDQVWHEWVLVLEGSAVLAFEDGREVTLGPGDHLEIPAHCRHRVAWTDPHRPTVWLAVHYPG